MQISASLEQLRRDLPLMMEWRHDFHMHPEIGFQEVRTSAKVAELLNQFGLQVHAGIGGTGVVGILQGRSKGSRSIGFRADMDALPMDERANVPYRSKHPGAFHGCGHDGHTATLLGAAKYLSQHRQFNGTIYFIFQSAEETLRGVPAMIANGLLKIAAFDEVYALHNSPMLAPGKIGVRAGSILSGADSLRIQVHGVSAHGSQPHCGVDAIVIACQLVNLLQTVVSRSLDPLDTGVVSIGIIRGGTATNVVAGLVELEGSIRSMTLENREVIHRRIRAICDGLAQSFGTSIQCEIGQLCPPVVNRPDFAKVVEHAATRVVGAENVINDVAPLMASDDFAHLIGDRPGAYFFIGQSGPTCHHPEYVFDDAIMPIGASVFVEIAHDRLSSNSPSAPGM
jgi:hippurate hydrolase